MYEELIELRKEISQIDHALWVLGNVVDGLIDKEIESQEINRDQRINNMKTKTKFIQFC